MTVPTRQQCGENPQKRPTTSGPHPDYLTWGGYPHGDRCVCGGIRYWHAVRPLLATDHRTASTHRHGRTDMIPADHITFNDDSTAWLVFKFGTGLNGKAWEELDRPCDTCGGETAERHGEDYLTHPCSDCINGRHTFEIDVEADTDWDVIYNAPPTTRTYRVSIVPNMILPIVDQEDGCPDTPHVCVFHGRMGGEPHNQWTLFGADGMEDELDPFPPDAKPGGWAAQLRVTA